MSWRKKKNAFLSEDTVLGTKKINTVHRAGIEDSTPHSLKSHPRPQRPPLPALGPPFHKQPATRTRGERGGGGGGDWHPIPGRGCTHLTPGRELGRWPFIWAREPVPAAPYTGDRSRAAGRYGPDHRHRPRAREAPSPPPSPCDQLPERRAETGGGGANAGRSGHVTAIRPAHWVTGAALMGGVWWRKGAGTGATT